MGEFTIKLDRTRRYAEVHGESTTGASYYQDGLPFDFHGNLVERALTPEHRERLERRKSAKASRHKDRDDDPADPDGEDEEEEAQAERTASRPVDPMRPTKGRDLRQKAPTSNGKVDLVAWATGKKRYRPYEVINAVKEQYHVAVTSTTQAVQFLVDEKVIARDLISPKVLPPAA